MTATADREYSPSLHPVHAVILAGAVPLFLGALLSDWAYSSSYQVQWTNFASWLIAGGLLFTGFALLWSGIDLLRADRRGGGRLMTFFLLLLATFVFGLINALVHAKDVWAAMPAGLILSLIVAVLAIAATWIAFSSLREGRSA
ncbi:MAG: hypothetical protein M3Q57_03375 [Pseudomonadota bacterium]|nr:hypothetical protein [Pseudomonadota bacterium]